MKRPPRLASRCARAALALQVALAAASLLLLLQLAPAAGQVLSNQFHDAPFVDGQPGVGALALDFSADKAGRAWAAVVAAGAAEALAPDASSLCGAAVVDVSARERVRIVVGECTLAAAAEYELRVYVQASSGASDGTGEQVVLPFSPYRHVAGRRYFESISDASPFLPALQGRQAVAAMPGGDVIVGYSSAAGPAMSRIRFDDQSSTESGAFTSLWEATGFAVPAGAADPAGRAPPAAVAVSTGVAGGAAEAVFAAGVGAEPDANHAYLARLDPESGTELFLATFGGDAAAAVVGVAADAAGAVFVAGTAEAGGAANELFDFSPFPASASAGEAHGFVSKRQGGNNGDRVWTVLVAPGTCAPFAVTGLAVSRETGAVLACGHCPDGTGLLVRLSPDDGSELETLSMPDGQAPDSLALGPPHPAAGRGAPAGETVLVSGRGPGGTYFVHRLAPGPAGTPLALDSASTASHVADGPVQADVPVHVSVDAASGAVYLHGGIDKGATAFAGEPYLPQSPDFDGMFSAALSADFVAEWTHVINPTRDSYIAGAVVLPLLPVSSAAVFTRQQGTILCSVARPALSAVLPVAAAELAAPVGATAFLTKEVTRASGEVLVVSSYKDDAVSHVTVDVPGTAAVGTLGDRSLSGYDFLDFSGSEHGVIVMTRTGATDEIAFYPYNTDASGAVTGLGASSERRTVDLDPGAVRVVALDVGDDTHAYIASGRRWIRVPYSSTSGLFTAPISRTDLVPATGLVVDLGFSDDRSTMYLVLDVTADGAPGIQLTALARDTVTGEVPDAEDAPATPVPGLYRVSDFTVTGTTTMVVRGSGEGTEVVVAGKSTDGSFSTMAVFRVGYPVVDGSPLPDLDFELVQLTSLDSEMTGEASLAVTEDGSHLALATHTNTAFGSASSEARLHLFRKMSSGGFRKIELVGSGLTSVDDTTSFVSFSRTGTGRLLWRYTRSEGDATQDLRFTVITAASTASTVATLSRPEAGASLPGPLAPLRFDMTVPTGRAGAVRVRLVPSDETAGTVSVLLAGAALGAAVGEAAFPAPAYSFFDSFALARPLESEFVRALLDDETAVVADAVAVRSGEYNAVIEAWDAFGGNVFGATPASVDGVSVAQSCYADQGDLLAAGRAGVTLVTIGGATRPERAPGVVLARSPGPFEWRAGAAWAADRVDISTGFSCVFEFSSSVRVADPAAILAADPPVSHGLAFVIHNDGRGDAAIGSGGTGLGFVRDDDDTVASHQDVTDALVVAIDVGAGQVTVLLGDAELGSFSVAVQTDASTTAEVALVVRREDGSCQLRVSVGGAAASGEYELTREECEDGVLAVSGERGRSVVGFTGGAPTDELTTLSASQAVVTSWRFCAGPVELPVYGVMEASRSGLEGAGDASFALVTSADGTDSIFLASTATGGTRDQDGVGGTDAMLTKTASDGTVEWVRLLGNEFDDGGRLVIADPAEDGGAIFVGDVSAPPLVAGAFEGVTIRGSSDTFVTRYASDGSREVGAGNLALLGGLNGVTRATGACARLDGAGTLTVYVAGVTTADSFGGVDVEDEVILFLAVYTGGLASEPVVRLERGVTSAVRLACSASFLYLMADVAGSLAGRANNDATGLTTDVFLQRRTAAGNVIWTSAIGSDGDDSVGGGVVADDGSNDLLLVGSGAQGVRRSAGSEPLPYSGGERDYFVARVASATGLVTWASTPSRVQATGDERAAALVHDAATGTVFVTGFSDATMDGQPNPGDRSTFVGRWSDAGEELWHQLEGDLRRQEGAALYLRGEQLLVVSTDAVLSPLEGDTEGVPQPVSTDVRVTRWADKPVFRAQPAALTTVRAGANTALSVVAESVTRGRAGVPLLFQWFLDGVPLASASAITPVLRVDGAGPGDAGVYRCEIRECACGSQPVLSEDVILEVDAAGARALFERTFFRTGTRSALAASGTASLLATSVVVVSDESASVTAAERPADATSVPLGAVYAAERVRVAGGLSVRFRYDVAAGTVPVMADTGGLQNPGFGLVIHSTGGLTRALLGMPEANRLLLWFDYADSTVSLLLPGSAGAAVTAALPAGASSLASPHDGHVTVSVRAGAAHVSVLVDGELLLSHGVLAASFEAALDGAGRAAVGFVGAATLGSGSFVVKLTELDLTAGPPGERVPSPAAGSLLNGGGGTLAFAVPALVPGTESGLPTVAAVFARDGDSAEVREFESYAAAPARSHDVGAVGDTVLGLARGAALSFDADGLAAAQSVYALVDKADGSFAVVRTEVGPARTAAADTEWEVAAAATNARSASISVGTGDRVVVAYEYTSPDGLVTVASVWDGAACGAGCVSEFTTETFFSASEGGTVGAAAALSLPAADAVPVAAVCGVRTSGRVYASAYDSAGAVAYDLEVDAGAGPSVVGCSLDAMGTAWLVVARGTELRIVSVADGRDATSLTVELGAGTSAAVASFDEAGTLFVAGTTSGEPQGQTNSDGRAATFVARYALPDGAAAVQQWFRLELMAEAAATAVPSVDALMLFHGAGGASPVLALAGRTDSVFGGAAWAGAGAVPAGAPVPFASVWRADFAVGAISSFPGLMVEAGDVVSLRAGARRYGEFEPNEETFVRWFRNSAEIDLDPDSYAASAVHVADSASTLGSGQFSFLASGKGAGEASFVSAGVDLSVLSDAECPASSRLANDDIAQERFAFTGRSGGAGSDALRVIRGDFLSGTASAAAGAVWLRERVDISQGFRIEARVRLADVLEASGSLGSVSFVIHDDPRGLSALSDPMAEDATLGDFAGVADAAGVTLTFERARSRVLVSAGDTYSGTVVLGTDVAIAPDITDGETHVLSVDLLTLIDDASDGTGAGPPSTLEVRVDGVLAYTTEHFAGAAFRALADRPLWAGFAAATATGQPYSVDVEAFKGCFGRRFGAVPRPVFANKLATADPGVVVHTVQRWPTSAGANLAVVGSTNIDAGTTSSTYEFKGPQGSTSTQETITIVPQPANARVQTVAGLPYENAGGITVLYTVFTIRGGAAIAYGRHDLLNDFDTLVDRYEGSLGSLQQDSVGEWVNGGVRLGDAGLSTGSVLCADTALDPGTGALFLAGTSTDSDIGSSVRATPVDPDRIVYLAKVGPLATNDWAVYLPAASVSSVAFSSGLAAVVGAHAGGMLSGTTVNGTDEGGGAEIDNTDVTGATTDVYVQLVADSDAGAPAFASPPLLLGSLGNESNPVAEFSADARLLAVAARSEGGAGNEGGADVYVTLLAFDAAGSPEAGGFAARAGGGAGDDVPTGVAMDGDKSVHVVGYTSSATFFGEAVDIDLRSFLVTFASDGRRIITAFLAEPRGETPPLSSRVTAFSLHDSTDFFFGGVEGVADAGVVDRVAVSMRSTVAVFSNAAPAPRTADTTSEFEVSVDGFVVSPTAETSLEWAIDGVPVLTNLSNGASYSVEDVDRGDAGSYTCVAAQCGCAYPRVESDPFVVEVNALCDVNQTLASSLLGGGDGVSYNGAAAPLENTVELVREPINGRSTLGGSVWTTYGRDIGAGFQVSATVTFHDLVGFRTDENCTVGEEVVPCVPSDSGFSIMLKRGGEQHRFSGTLRQGTATRVEGQVVNASPSLLLRFLPPLSPDATTPMTLEYHTQVEGGDVQVSLIGSVDLLGIFDGEPHTIVWQMLTGNATVLTRDDGVGGTVTLDTSGVPLPSQHRVSVDGVSVLTRVRNSPEEVEAGITVTIPADLAEPVEVRSLFGELNAMSGVSTLLGVTAVTGTSKTESTFRAELLDLTACFAGLDRRFYEQKLYRSEREEDTDETPGKLLVAEQGAAMYVPVTQGNPPFVDVDHVYTFDPPPTAYQGRVKKYADRDEATLEWDFPIDEVNNNTCVGVAEMPADGRLVVTGSFQGRFRGGVGVGNNYDSYILVADKTGALLNHVVVGFPNGSTVLQGPVVADDDGRFWVAGFTTSPALFDGVPTGAVASVFVAMYGYEPPADGVGNSTLTFLSAAVFPMELQDDELDSVVLNLGHDNVIAPGSVRVLVTDMTLDRARDSLLVTGYSAAASMFGEGNADDNDDTFRSNACMLLAIPASTFSSDVVPTLARFRSSRVDGNAAHHMCTGIMPDSRGNLVVSRHTISGNNFQVLTDKFNAAGLLLWTYEAVLPDGGSNPTSTSAVVVLESDAVIFFGTSTDETSLDFNGLPHELDGIAYSQLGWAVKLNSFGQLTWVSFLAEVGGVSRSTSTFAAALTVRNEVFVTMAARIVSDDDVAVIKLQAEDVRPGVTGTSVVSVGGTLTLTAVLDPFLVHTAAFQWQRDGEDIPLQSGPSLVVEDVSLSDAGAYSVLVGECTCASFRVSSPQIVVSVLERPTAEQSVVTCAASGLPEPAVDNAVLVGGSITCTVVADDPSKPTDGHYAYYSPNACRAAPGEAAPCDEANPVPVLPANPGEDGFVTFTVPAGTLDDSVLSHDVLVSIEAAHGGYETIASVPFALAAVPDNSSVLECRGRFSGQFKDIDDNVVGFARTNEEVTCTITARQAGRAAAIPTVSSFFTTDGGVVRSPFDVPVSRQFEFSVTLPDPDVARVVSSQVNVDDNIDTTIFVQDDDLKASPETLLECFVQGTLRRQFRANNKVECTIRARDADGNETVAVTDDFQYNYTRVPANLVEDPVTSVLQLRDSSESVLSSDHSFVITVPGLRETDFVEVSPLLKSVDDGSFGQVLGALQFQRVLGVPSEESTIACLGGGSGTTLERPNVPIACQITPLDSVGAPVPSRARDFGYRLTTGLSGTLNFTIDPEEELAQLGSELITFEFSLPEPDDIDITAVVCWHYGEGHTTEVWVDDRPCIPKVIFQSAIPFISVQNNLIHDITLWSTLLDDQPNVNVRHRLPLPLLFDGADLSAVTDVGGGTGRQVWEFGSEFEWNNDGNYTNTGRTPWNVTVVRVDPTDGEVVRVVGAELPEVKADVTSRRIQPFTLGIDASCRAQSVVRVELDPGEDDRNPGNNFAEYPVWPVNCPDLPTVQSSFACEGVFSGLLESFARNEPVTCTLEFRNSSNLAVTGERTDVTISLQSYQPEDFAAPETIAFAAIGDALPNNDVLVACDLDPDDDSFSHVVIGNTEYATTSAGAPAADGTTTRAEMAAINFDGAVERTLAILDGSADGDLGGAPANGLTATAEAVLVQPGATATHAVGVVVLAAPHMTDAVVNGLSFENPAAHSAGSVALVRVRTDAPDGSATEVSWVFSTDASAPAVVHSATAAAAAGDGDEGRVSLLVSAAGPIFVRGAGAGAADVAVTLPTSGDGEDPARWHAAVDLDLAASPAEVVRAAWYVSLPSNFTLRGVCGSDSGDRLYAFGDASESDGMAMLVLKYARPACAAGQACTEAVEPEWSSLTRTQQDPATLDEQADACVVGRGGGVIVAGHTNAPYAGDLTGERDVFLTKWTSDGVLVWARQYGTTAAPLTAVAVVEEAATGRVHVALNEGVVGLSLELFVPALITVNQYGDSEVDAGRLTADFEFAGETGGHVGICVTQRGHPITLGITTQERDVSVGAGFARDPLWVRWVATPFGDELNSTEEVDEGGQRIIFRTTTPSTGALLLDARFAADYQPVIQSEYYGSIARIDRPVVSDFTVERLFDTVDTEDSVIIGEEVEVFVIATNPTIGDQVTLRAHTSRSCEPVTRVNTVMEFTSRTDIVGIGTRLDFTQVFTNETTGETYLAETKNVLVPEFFGRFRLCVRKLDGGEFGEWEPVADDWYFNVLNNPHIDTLATSSPLTPDFDRLTFGYDMTLGSDEIKFNVTLALVDPDADVLVQQLTSETGALASLAFTTEVNAVTNVIEIRFETNELAASDVGDDITVQVTAVTGTPVSTYRITAKRAPSDSTRLQTLSALPLELVPRFSDDVFNYTASAGGIDPRVVTVLAFPRNERATTVMTVLDAGGEEVASSGLLQRPDFAYNVSFEGENLQVLVTVTAEDGDATGRFYLNIVKESSDTELADLEVRPGSPAGALALNATESEDAEREQTVWSAPSLFGQSTLLLTVDIHPDSTWRVRDPVDGPAGDTLACPGDAAVAAFEGFRLPAETATFCLVRVGETQVDIEVKSLAGNTELWRLVVDRAPSTESRLGSLCVSSLAEGGAEDGDVRDQPALCNANGAGASALVQSAVVEKRVTAVQVDADPFFVDTTDWIRSASVSVGGAAYTEPGARTLELPSVGVFATNVTVTAQDGATTTTYTLEVERVGSLESHLESLSVMADFAAPTLQPAFSRSTFEYTVDVIDAVPSVLFSFAAAPLSTVTANAAPASSPTPRFDLEFGSNRVAFVVTAEDGATSSTYVVDVVRSSVRPPPQILNELSVPTWVAARAHHASATVDGFGVFAGGADTGAGDAAAALTQVAAFNGEQWYASELSAGRQLLSGVGVGGRWAVFAGGLSGAARDAEWNGEAAAEPGAFSAVVDVLDLAVAALEAPAVRPGLAAVDAAEGEPAVALPGPAPLAALLSAGRSRMAATSLPGTSLAFFGGGLEPSTRAAANGSAVPVVVESSRVDVVDAAAGGAADPSGPLTLPEARSHMVAGALTGPARVLFVGGRRTDWDATLAGAAGGDEFLLATSRHEYAASARVDVWVVGEARWDSSLATLAQARYGSAAAVADNRMFVFGGVADGGEYSAVLEIIDGSGGGLSVEVQTVLFPRAYSASAAIDGYVLFYGGERSPFLDDGGAAKLGESDNVASSASGAVDVYVMETGEVTRFVEPDEPSLRRQRMSAAVVVNNQAFVMGGETASAGGNATRTLAQLTGTVPCINLDQCNENGECVGVAPFETCECFTGFQGDKCEELNSALSLTVASIVVGNTALPVVAGMWTVLIAAGKQSGRPGESLLSPTGIHVGFLPFVMHMQLFITPLAHNDELREIFHPFRAQNTVALNSPLDDADVRDDETAVGWSHGMLRKGIILAGLVLITAVMSGTVLETCLFRVRLRLDHFIFLFYIALPPMAESVFDVPEQPVSTIQVCLAVAVGVVFFYAVAVVRRPFTRQVRRYVLPGRGWHMFSSTYRAKNAKKAALSESFSTRSVNLWWEGLRRKLNQYSCGVRVRSAPPVQAEASRKGAKKAGKYQARSYRDWEIMSKSRLDLEDLAAPVAYQTGAEVDSWQAFPHKFWFDSVVLYDPRAARGMGCCGRFLNLVRSWVSHWWMFVFLAYMAAYIATAVTFDGSEQFLAAASLSGMYLLALLFFVPLRPEVMVEHVVGSAVLCAQMALFALIMFDRSFVGNIFIVAVMQSSVVLLGFFVARLVNVDSRALQHYLKIREKELGLPMAPPKKEKIRRGRSRQALRPAGDTMMHTSSSAVELADVSEAEIEGMEAGGRRGGGLGGRSPSKLSRGSSRRSGGRSGGRGSGRR